MPVTAPASLSVPEAQRLILDRARPLAAERVALGDSLGRVLAAAVVARLDVPPWDNSAMDGYAVRAADVAPGVPLPVALDAAAGSPAGAVLPAGAVARIATGAPLPAGADAVVPVEATEGPDGEGRFAEVGESVRFAGPPAPGAHVRRRGEDVARGAVAVAAGATMGPPHVAMAATVGRAVVAVHRRPRVAIVPTGDELVEVDEAGTADRIVNGNAHGLAAAVAEAGGVPIVLPIVPDDPDETRRAIRAALAADAVVTIGGVSAGPRDHVRAALVDAGVELVVRRVAIRPGGPFAFGAAGERLAFALPGNPVSAQVTFELFVRPALLRMGGRAACLRRPIRARLGAGVVADGGKTLYLRARLEGDGGDWIATPCGPQGSAILSGLVAANALAVVPAGAGALDAGAEVDALPFGSSFLDAPPAGAAP